MDTKCCNCRLQIKGMTHICSKFLGCHLTKSHTAPIYVHRFARIKVNGFLACKLVRDSAHSRLFVIQRKSRVGPNGVLRYPSFDQPRRNQATTQHGARNGDAGRRPQESQSPSPVPLLEWPETPGRLSQAIGAYDICDNNENTGPGFSANAIPRE